VGSGSKPRRSTGNKKGNKPKPKKQKMKFIDSSHIYINEKGERYRSVTNLLHSLESYKDWDTIAKKYAKKHGMTLEAVQAAWNHEKDISIVRGKNIHAIEENHYLNNKSCVVFSEEHGRPMAIFGNPVIDDVKERKTTKLEEGIYPELMVWLDSVKLAGQADYIEIVDNVINVDDYKTNKKIDTNSYVKWDGTSDKLKYPCSHLDDCNFNIYSLQLNMYAYIIKRNNPKLKIGRMRIIHFLFNEDGTVKDKVFYIVPDLQKEIKTIISLLKSKKL
jgi:hypothetical protein